MKTYLICAMHSGSGKTVFTYGLLKWLKDRGLKVQSFKTGPDYIDPMYHSFITNLPCINLDPFFLEPTEDGLQSEISDLRKLFKSHTKDVDIAVIEGAMGYFDGIYNEGRRASASVVADAVNAEGILILDAARKPSAKDVIQYLESFDNTILYHRAYQNRIKYLVWNRGTLKEYSNFLQNFYHEIKSHENLKGIKILGYIEHNDRLKIESRHLGLHMPFARNDLCELADAMQESMKKHISLELFLPEFAGEGKALRNDEPRNGQKEEKKKSRFRVGIARDEAFCFFYQDNLTVLEDAGFSICYFSPLKEEYLPKDIDLLWIPGGYPELFAKRLYENKSMREEIQRAIKEGLPTIAECGGFMYLHNSMEDMQKNIYEMCKVIEGEVFRTQKLQRFGYITVEAKKDTLLLKKNQKIRGHEFHYFDSTNNGVDALATKANGSKSWDCVHGNESLFAGFLHIYFGRNEFVLQNLVEACSKFKNRKHLNDSKC